MKQFEYRVAVFQQGHVTHDGGRWVGSIAPTEEGAIDTCMSLQPFLSEAGADGWELCATVPMAGGQASNLIFKR